MWERAFLGAHCRGPLCPCPGALVQGCPPAEDRMEREQGRLLWVFLEQVPKQSELTKEELDKVGEETVIAPNPCFS